MADVKVAVLILMDVLISGLIVTALLRSRTGLKATDKFIKKIISYVVRFSAFCRCHFVSIWQNSSGEGLSQADDVAYQYKHNYFPAYCKSSAPSGINQLCELWTMLINTVLLHFSWST